jgi:hypothetical protein
MKLCFSKWSEMWQKSGDSSTLIFNATPPNTRWLFHRHEHRVSMVEYKVSRVTRATDEDCSWTLWDMRNHATEAIDPEAGTSAETQSPSDESDTCRTHRRCCHDCQLTSERSDICFYSALSWCISYSNV